MQSWKASHDFVSWEDGEGGGVMKNGGDGGGWLWLSTVVILRMR